MDDSTVKNTAQEMAAEVSDTLTQKKADLQTGEKGFTIILFLICAFILYQAVLLWKQAPGIAGPAIVPLIAIGFATLLVFVSIIANIWKTTPLTGCHELGRKAKAVMEYLLPLNIVVALLAIAAYCVLLYFKVSFYIVTPIFLYGLMTFLAKGNYVKNILWTALVMAFLIVVFRMLFSVVLP